MHVAFIGGGGVIGATAAYSLATTRPELDISLVDVAADAAEGHAIDIAHGRSVGQIHGLGPAPVAEGRVQSRPSEADSLADVDCAVVTASIAPPAGTAERGARIRYLERNRSLADDIGAMLGARDPIPVVVASNPMDVMTHHLWRATGWDRRRFVGYSLSETARVKAELARRLDCRPDQVYCPVLGEHGEHLVPVFSRLRVDDEPVAIHEDERDHVREYARAAPYTVIDLRGERDSSRWVTGQGIARLVATLLDGGPDQPIGLAAPLAGEYGFDDVCLSVPVWFDETGWTEIVEWDLAPDERAELEAAAASVRADLER